MTLGPAKGSKSRLRCPAVYGMLEVASHEVGGENRANLRNSKPYDPLTNRLRVSKMEPVVFLGP